MGLLLAALLGGAGLRGAQGEKSARGYTADQLNCSWFLEITESRILTQSGGRDLEQKSVLVQTCTGSPET